MRARTRRSRQTGHPANSVSISWGCQSDGPRKQETEAIPWPAHVVEQTFNTNLWNGKTLQL
jgi:hypothetical protein